MPDYVELSTIQVSLVAGLIFVNAIISLIFRLKLEVSLLIASLRTVLQLTLIGLVLRWIFQRDEWYWLAMLAVTMTIVAGVTASSRSQRKYRGMWLDSLFAIGLSCWVTTLITLRILLHGHEPWWQAQYAVPLLGMVLGNALTGISIGLNSLTDACLSRRGEIESDLAMGATGFEAALPAIRNAVRSGMIPIINSMMVVGLVSLPGMMTGQLLSGVDPVDAVKYQIVIMFLIASATSLGTVGVVLLGFRRLFNQRHQFLYAEIQTR